MSKATKKSSKKAPKKLKLDPKRLAKLFKTSKSISKVAKHVGASYVGVRLNLLKSGAYKPGK